MQTYGIGQKIMEKRKHAGGKGKKHPVASGEGQWEEVKSP